MSSTRVCLVGLPDAGKTTFLAAFWAAARDTPRQGVYRIRSFPEDPSYLQGIADEWFHAQEVSRNTSASISPIELQLEAPAGTEMELLIPDLSGESFRDAVTERQLDAEVAKLVAESDLILFFVNAATATCPMSLAELAPGADAQSTQISEFDPKLLETDLLNAELLQVLPNLCDAPERPPRVVVVVSAWDIVDGIGQLPAEWLKVNQPMFAQVVAEYGRHSPIDVIGVSAQGADYKAQPTVVEKAPRDRPLVVTDDGRSTDIGWTFKWLEQQEAGERGGD